MDSSERIAEWKGKMADHCEAIAIRSDSNSAKNDARDNLYRLMGLMAQLSGMLTR